MPKNRVRTLSRHLLALCTFLVPLGVLTWLGQRELSRQAAEAQTALEREALQFLRGAVQALEQQFTRQLPELARDARAFAADHSLAGATRRLRQAGYGAVVDLVRLDDQGAMVAPLSGGMRPLLPLSRDPRTRGDHKALTALQLADLLIARGLLQDAEQELERGIEALPDMLSERSERLLPEFLELEAMLEFRLATVRWHRAAKAAEEHADAAELQQAAISGWQHVRDLADAARAAALGRRGRGGDDGMACGLLAELALAEATPTSAPRLELLQAIASGHRDPVQESLLRAVADRAAQGLLPDAASVRNAAQALAEVQIHLQARSFAAAYDLYLQETVRRRLLGRPDPALWGDAELRLLVCTIESQSSLLLLLPDTGAEAPPGAVLAVRLDLGQLLAGALERFLRGDDTFVLAIADADNHAIVGPPAAPSGLEPPTMAAFGLQLRAYPADVAGFVAAADRAARQARVLALVLFLVATVGALWLWRSVSREAELLQLKVDLVSRVSHELKTPLALISLYGETIGMGRVRDAAQSAKFGNIIHREAGRLTTLIQRILDFSRQQAGSLVYEPVDTDLSATLAEIATAYAPHIEARGGSLTTALAPGLHAVVDRTALASAVINLLENAVKYAGEEQDDRNVHLELRRDGPQAVVEVLDRGRGVPQAERQRIFDSFYRASNAGEVRGAGLGLSLVRHFATAHGGDALTLPRPGGGSIFRIVLPLQRPPT